MTGELDGRGFAICRGLLAAAEGAALRVNGKAVFSRSGIIRIPARSRSATHRNIPLGASSLVLAVLRQHQPGVHVEAAVPNPAANSFTVYLSRRTRRAVEVAWLVVN